MPYRYKCIGFERQLANKTLWYHAPWNSQAVRDDIAYRQSVIAKRRELKRYLGQVFNSILGCIGRDYMVSSCQAYWVENLAQVSSCQIWFVPSQYKISLEECSRHIVVHLQPNGQF